MLTGNLQLIQIGETKAPEVATVTILQMFQQLADREAQMIRDARERVTKQIRTNS